MTRKRITHRAASYLAWKVQCPRPFDGLNLGGGTTLVLDNFEWALDGEGESFKQASDDAAYTDGAYPEEESQ